MIKHVIALAAGALFSLHASAAYIQYNLSGPVSGYIVQHDDDKSIATYNLRVQGEHINALFSPSGIFDTLTGASSNFWEVMGPTNLSVYDNRTDYYLEYLSLDFRGAAGAYTYSAQYTQRPIPDLPSTAPSFPLTTWFNGSATLGTPSASLVAALDAQGGYADGIPRIVPTQNVPEPASLALMAAGGLGLAGLRRRKQARGAA